ncbi:MAG: hypothetical protein EPN46_13630 [Candidimonas sp.]|nr:MAG: hypothetical protein EPN77_04385 [Candidimonas sp.]TAM25028.1 MAG: hypothetical protein EPN62_05260 [Candidimonas sp.]TAM73813.1 MAG: hypothetical protein EPN46_13630 [Candidimonas sp.]
MKKLIVLAAVMVLAGCAAPQSGLRLNDLRTRAYFRTERSVPFTSFAPIQMALFKHQAACGGDITFTASPRNASYAIVSSQKPPLDWRDTIVIDLTLMQDSPVRAHVYSYHAGTGAQIQKMFNAMIRPNVCVK